MKNTMEKFADWFIEHDKHIMEARLKREKHALNKELHLLEDERDRMRGHLARIDALIEKQEELKAALPDKPEGGV